jgi:SAM-dependent methyltransferase
MNLRMTKYIKSTWNKLANQDAMHFIETSRNDWNTDSFLESGKKTIDELSNLIGIWPTDGLDTALEIGCGIGRLSFALADSFNRVIGIDSSEIMIQKANELKDVLGNKNVDFYCNNGYDFDFVHANSCDFCFSFLVFQHIPDQQIIINYINEIGRVTKPGGNIFFQIPAYQNNNFIRVWQLLQLLIRKGLIVGELLQIIPPDKGLAFRGIRMTMGKVEAALTQSQLEVIILVRTPSKYRFADNIFFYCQKT